MESRRATTDRAGHQPTRRACHSRPMPSSHRARWSDPLGWHQKLATTRGSTASMAMAAMRLGIPEIVAPATFG